MCTSEKIFNWSNEKNEELKITRNVCFEDVIDCFIEGRYYGTFVNPSRNFSDQQVYLVEIDGYPHIVPFVETEYEIFLKTIIPDRRFKKFME